MALDCEFVTIGAGAIVRAVTHALARRIRAKLGDRVKWYRDDAEVDG